MFPVFSLFSQNKKQFPKTPNKQAIISPSIFIMCHISNYRRTSYSSVSFLFRWLSVSDRLRKLLLFGKTKMKWLLSGLEAQLYIRACILH